MKFMYLRKALRSVCIIVLPDVIKFVMLAVKSA